MCIDCRPSSLRRSKYAEGLRAYSPENRAWKDFSLSRWGAYAMRRIVRYPTSHRFYRPHYPPWTFPPPLPPPLRSRVHPPCGPFVRSEIRAKLNPNPYVNRTFDPANRIPHFVRSMRALYQLPPRGSTLLYLPLPTYCLLGRCQN